MRRIYQGIGDLRERLYGFSRDFTARAADISVDRLCALEQEGAAPSVFELERLGRLFGIEPDRLAEEEIRLGAGDAIETLGLLDEFRELDAPVKARVVSAANAARDVVLLRRLTRHDPADADPRRAFLRRVQSLPPPRRAETPHAEGRHYAQYLRRRLGLGNKAIPSVRDLVGAQWPEITVLYANLGGSGGIAGLSFADAVRGPTIVINLQGKNENPAVRRFSLAHELLHLLVDWNRHEPLATLSGFLSEGALDRESRANAFAVRFLCPESVVRSSPQQDTESLLRRLIADYGLHYSAARLYVRNLMSRDMPHAPPESMTGLTVDGYADAEEPRGVRRFPIEDVPPERRTLVAALAARAWSAGLISRSRFAELLDVPPTRDVERVSDVLEFDRPGTA